MKARRCNWLGRIISSTDGISAWGYGVVVQRVFVISLEECHGLALYILKDSSAKYYFLFSFLHYVSTNGEYAGLSFDLEVDCFMTVAYCEIFK